MVHFINFLTLCGFLFAFYSVGYLLNFAIKIVEREDTLYYAVFNYIFSGLVFSVSVTACFFTGFKTTSIFFLLLFGYMAFINRSKLTNTCFHFRKLYFLPFFVLIGYLLSVFKGYTLEGDYTHHIFLDYVYYKQVIFNLIKGQENISEWANILDTEYDGISAYHYFELWLTILINKINGLPTLLNFMVYVPTLFISSILIGILSLLENNRIITTTYILIGIALLFVGQVYLPFYEHFFWSGYQHVFTSVGYVPISEKLFPFSLFGIAAFCAFSKNKYILFLVYTLFLSIASFAATPAMFGGFYLSLIANLYFKFITDKRIYILAFFPLLYAFFLIAFKQSFDGYIENASQFDFHTILENFTFKNIISYFVLRPSYFLFPVFLLSVTLLVRKKLSMDKSFLLLILFFIGLVGSTCLIALLYSTDANSVQLINLPLYGFSFGLLTWLIAKINKRMYISLLLVMSMIVINFYYNYIFFYQKLNENRFYSKEYIDIISKKLDKQEPIPIAAFYNLNVTFNFVMFNGLGQEIAYLDNVGLIRMTDSRLKESENIKNFGTNIFYKFVKENNYSLKDNLAEAQLAFLREYRIRYLLIQKGEKISAEIENLIVKSYEDSISGNKFCVIDIDLDTNL